eukprot:jgi/Chlat1/3015/Chrsp201S03281
MEAAGARIAVLTRQLDPSASGSSWTEAQEKGVSAQATYVPAQHGAREHADKSARLDGFPSATPSSVFPPPRGDYFHLDELLTAQEQALRLKVREVAEQAVAPVTTAHWEKATFPFEVVPHIANLGIGGGTVQGYGCAGLSVTAQGAAVMELARVDASVATFVLVHNALAMATIGMLGSEEQKSRLLPALARFQHVGAWALTEPDYGSDASGLATEARRVEGGWRLSGRKRWIGNATFAEIIVVMARNSTDNQINAFVVRKGTPGLRTSKIEHKVALRLVQNADIEFQDVFVPDCDRLEHMSSFRDTAKVLAISRIMVAWLPVGISMGVYDMCARYLKERKQFGVPLASMQLAQERLARMLGGVQAQALMAWRVSKLYEAGIMTEGQASLAKMWNTRCAREVCQLGREALGGNGVVVDFHVGKAFADIEAIFTYEGTYDVNALVVGRELTGISAIKPRGSH